MYIYNHFECGLLQNIDVCEGLNQESDRSVISLIDYTVALLIEYLSSPHLHECFQVIILRRKGLGLLMYIQWLQTKRRDGRYAREN